MDALTAPEGEASLPDLEPEQPAVPSTPVPILRCQSPDITEPIVPRRGKKKQTQAQDPSPDEEEGGAENQGQDEEAEEGMDVEGGPEQESEATRPASRRGRGRGGGRKRGGRRGSRGRGRGRATAESEEPAGDLGVSQIVEDVKEMQLEEGKGGLGFLGQGVFGESSYQSGGIPGLDVRMDEPNTSDSGMSSGDSSLKLADILASITDDDDLEGNRVRRSSRIKSLEKGKSRRREVVFSSKSTESPLSATSSRSLSASNDDDSSSNGGNSIYSPKDDSGYPLGAVTPTFDSPIFKTEDSGDSKPFKVKSRWRYSSDAETLKLSPADGLPSPMDNVSEDLQVKSVDKPPEETFVPSKDLIKKSGHLMFNKGDLELQDKLKKFQGLEESIFRTARKVNKESKGMTCDCFLTAEDIERGENGCEEDCLNRLLMVECGPRCTTGDRCMNKKFQKKQYATLEVFKTEKKGHGLRTLQQIPEGGFVIEYVGEVLDPYQFEKRTKEYAKGNQEHFYFMALKSDAIIDATLKGNCSRFINHSCEPNCETQKWTVNGELRIGFFALRDLKPGEEIVFDYQFQRYGKKAQKCYCGTPSCRGWIGEDEEEGEYEKEDRSPEEESESVGITEKKKAKPRKSYERKKKKEIALRILEDIALEEELYQLERTGLKNKYHTLALSRLMVRAEKWDDRIRLLHILLNGDTPCLRLFLDYRGLKLLYNWMVTLPLPAEDAKEQPLESEECHLLFLKVLKSLQIPHKTMLLDSKILSLVESWSKVPERTLAKIETQETVAKIETQETVAKIETQDTLALPSETIKSESEPQDAVKSSGDVSVVEENTTEQTTEDNTEKMEVDDNTAASVVEPTPVYTEWSLKGHATELLSLWADLKEVFRIPKKERVEQMKEHEREADKASSVVDTSSIASSATIDNRFNRWSGGRTFGRERRVPVLDSYGSHRQFPKPRDPYAHLSKEERRELFAQQVKHQEELEKQQKLRQQHDELIMLHQARCSALGLDHQTTPIVDKSGQFFFDPVLFQWKKIDPNDPTLPPGIKRLLEAVKCSEATYQQEPSQTEEPEYVFPPWPEGLPPPPPLPPAVLPDGWKMAVDDQGRCYYYHVRTRKTQWTPPNLQDCNSVESSESSDSETVDEENDGIVGKIGIIVPAQKPVTSHRTKLVERAERRKKTGLVQERIISPRTEEDRSTISKAVIRARKLEVLEEKRQAIEAARMEFSLKQVDESIENVINGEPSTKPNETAGAVPSPGSNTSQTCTPILNVELNEDDDDDACSSSPIETELDISLSLASISDDRSEDRTADDEVVIPGLGFDPRDGIAMPSASSEPTVSVKKDRQSKLDKKQKSLAYKKLPSEKSKDAFRKQIANVVITFLNPYRKPDCKTGKILTTEDFKHLARKMTHAIVLKELKHAREGKPLEVTEGVKQKTKEYIKKFMARFGSSNYVPSPETKQ